MNKAEAHEILNNCRENYAVSLARTTQALRLTGDISGLFGESLRIDGNERGHDRPLPIQSQGVETNFSYSRYLDFPTAKGVAK